MVDDPIMAEMRRIKAQILAESGGTVQGLFKRLRRHPPPRTVEEFLARRAAETVPGTDATGEVEPDAEPDAEPVVGDARACPPPPALTASARP